MAILKYEEINHVELNALPRDRTIIMMNIGPLEEHGPHLPFSTDPIQSMYFAETVSKELQKLNPDFNFLILPNILAGSDTMLYTGTVEVKPKTLRTLLSDYTNQLAKDGFKNIVVFNAHGGPRHIVVIEEVAEKMLWRKRVRMLSASSRIIPEIINGGFADKIKTKMTELGFVLSDDEYKTIGKVDIHAGLLETSVMLAIRPDLVKPIYRELRPATLDHLYKFKRSSGKTLGDGLGYVGSPHLARPEIGSAVIAVIIEDIVPLLNQFVRGEDVKKKFRSKFYYIPFFRTDFKVLLFVFIYMFAFGTAWLLMIRLMSGATK